MVDAPGRSAIGRPRDQPARSGTWPQQVRVEVTRIRHQTRIARARSTSAHAHALVEAIEAHLCDAEAVIRQRPWYRRAAVLDWWHGTSIEQAFRSLHAARVFLVEIRGVSREVDKAFDAALRAIGEQVGRFVVPPGVPADPLLEAGIVGGVIHIALRWIEDDYTPGIEVVTDSALRLGMVLGRPPLRRTAAA